MANPQAYTYTAAGARTVQQRLDIVDAIYRVSIEETPITSMLAKRKVTNHEPMKVEDDIQALDNTNFHAEGSVAPAAASTARTTRTGRCQLLKKTAEVTHDQLAAAQYGIADELAYQTLLRRAELLKDGELFVISDQAAQAMTPANARVAKMQGMGSIITTNTNLTANFNQVNFNAQVTAAFATEGGNPTEIYLDATRKVAVAAWTDTVTRYHEELKRLVNEVQVYATPIGQTVNFHLHKYMPQNIVGLAAVCLGLDMGPQTNWELLEYIPISTLELPDLGGTKSRQLEWRFCVLPGVEKSNFSFAG